MPRAPRHVRTALALSLVVLVPAIVLAGDKPLAKGDPARGKSVYTKTCILCHFADGSGGKKLLPTGKPSRDFRDPAFWATRTDEQLRATVNNGMPKSGMVAWKGILKPQEIEDVLAYEKTFAKKPGDAKAAAEAKAAGVATKPAADTPKPDPKPHD
jgi:mono/diheme cytochrome c family protein